MSAFARKAAGLDPFGGRFTTATMGAQIQQMGGQLGRGSSGDMRFGWYNGGAGVGILPALSRMGRTLRWAARTVAACWAALWG
ncbi:hypothetical protein [Gordonia westfalica]|uniref:Uncharacterized protein n=1 Tax=Gordonia westfalica TaxID=158898 RepID=A0A1H2DPJ2_9ACTN|nr:hypothetical protein [Gordonia westfalica]SDT84769.1 hypothetical protein SAMN04488548_1113 [Gordonia westfalica]